MKILAIESSCDETAAAVVEDGRKVLSSVVASQVEEHKLYGGVVPEIASRRHAEAIVPVVRQSLEQADVILGIDNNLAQEAIAADILEPYEAHGIKFIPEHLQDALGKGNYLTPYDYSHFAVIYDTQSDIPAPHDPDSLTSKTYADKLIIMDPRTSSTGLGFLSWTVSIYGDQNEAYWKRLAPSVHAMTKGWSEGWGLFTKGEAPLCISYTTSPAYCAIEENNERYVALTFDEGHVMQVEGAGLIKGAYNKKGAKTFIDYLISTDMQKKLPLKQWMYPANKMARINKAFAKVSPVPETTLPIDSKKTMEAVEKAVAAVNK